MKLGEYQLANLIRNQVKFLYLDLRSEEVRKKQSPNDFIFGGATPVSPEQVLEYARTNTPDKAFPVVLICETSEKSMASAQVLEQDAFINVYVLDGGTGSIQFLT